MINKRPRYEDTKQESNKVRRENHEIRIKIQATVKEEN